MTANPDPAPHLIDAVQALGLALETLTRRTNPVAPDAVRQDSEERVDELDLLLELIRRVLRRP